MYAPCQYGPEQTSCYPSECRVTLDERPIGQAPLTIAHDVVLYGSAPQSPERPDLAAEQSVSLICYWARRAERW